MAKETAPTEFVEGDSLEPDESRTPLEFADEEFLTVEQAAKYLNCSTIQVRDWLSTGQLTSIPAGSIERIRRTELEAIGNPDKEAAKEFEKDHT